MRRASVLTVALAVAACGSSTHLSLPMTSAPPTSGVDLSNARVKLTKLASLGEPTALATRRGDDTLYVTEQAGRVRAIRNGALQRRPALDLTDRVGAGGERGLLGLAFSPDGRKLYVDYTNGDGDTRIDEFSMRRGRVADRESRRELLAIAQPQTNHNGGQLAFGPDGMLYIGMGDGGAADDRGDGHVRGGNGQSLDTLLGKILRIDPKSRNGNPYSVPSDNPFAHGGGRPEIWSYGLRNPWRFSFDRATGDLWIGDVGQDHWEEIDFAPGRTGRAANFGWNRFEGTHRYLGKNVSGTRRPILEYSHQRGCSVTGGFVYRGAAIPALVGAYLYADYCSGEVRAFTPRDGTAAGDHALGVHAAGISSFGQDNEGELYVLSQGDGVLRIDPT
jgi:glucose/arabinose dehydrogenase